MRHVLVLNQFALPRDQSGGTRHVDLFSRVEGWTATIVAGNRNYATQERFRTSDSRFNLVLVPSYTGASLVRMLGWGLYSAEAALVGLTQRQVDVVYASSPNMLVPVAGWLVARVRRAPLIVEIRDLWPESIIGAGALTRGSRLHAALVRLERWIYHHADHLVVVTPGWEPHFAELGISPDRVTVVPNGTEVSDFELSEDRDALREELGFTRPTAVYAGAHGPANGLHMVLDAARKQPYVDFVLVGSGSEKAALITAAEDLTNVRFLDPMPKSRLARVLKAADLGIHCIEPLPILTAGMSPNKLFDYMAAGLPTVSNAGSGLRAVISDGEAGRTGAPDSLPALIADVTSASSELQQRWRSAAREVVQTRFSRTGAAHTLSAVLDQVSASRLRRRQARRSRVVHLTTAHRPTDNRIFRKECVGLKSAGFDVHVVAQAPGDSVVDDIPIHALPQRSSRLARMVTGPVDALRTLATVKPALVHIHDPELIPLGMIWKLFSRGIVIFDAHEDLPKQVQGKPYLPDWSRPVVAAFARLLEQAADSTFDAVVAATPSIARNFSNARTTLVQNYPWLRDFPEQTPYESAPVGTFSYVGGASKERGALEMVRAAEQHEPPFHITTAGPATEDALTLLQNASNVTHLGVRPVAEVPGIVSGAQVGLVLFHALPNHMECQPTKLFEYMAAGRPFIASDLPYWREMLGRHDCGVFVDPTDVDGITAAMDELVSDPGMASRLGRNGRQAVEGNFCFEQEQKSLVRLVTDLLRAR